MTRAKIAALALVNWKGVFYERYLLDAHVTALEGMNGAGKTTVMIAAYIALLPDMSKLRFTNLGETAATGGDRGIWGRLGEPGRPSYTVLDLETSEGRVLAGVRLVRASEPTVEPTAFIVTGLDAERRLSDLLLVRQLDGDHVPELDEIKRAVEAAGGTFTSYRAIRDYFAELFDRGVTPMRLDADDERTKLNEMLRTSMTGGISRALTSELRNFLLKEETGLGDTLSRMRANLDACARTRQEVYESRRLEREITAIYEAGMEMFGDAIHAARAAASEAERDVLEARPLVDEARRTSRMLEELVGQLEKRAADVAHQLTAAQGDLARLTTERDRGIAAAAVRERLSAIERELTALSTEEVTCRDRATLATTKRSAARDERSRSQAAYERAAHGLADLQAGIDELVRTAHAHRRYTARLAEARQLLDREVDGAHAVEAIAELDRERGQIEAELARIAREGRDLEGRRIEHARALQALATIDPLHEPGSGTHAHARGLLAKLADREAARGRLDELERDRVLAVQLASRQAQARALAESLGFAASTDVLAELTTAERALADHARIVDAHRVEVGIRERRLAELAIKLAGVEERSARWELAITAIKRLAAPVTNRADVVALRDRYVEEAHTLAAQRDQIEARRTAAQDQARRLEHNGQDFAPELLQLCDDLGGELLANRFDDVDPNRASWIEARLGPLTHALIVDDLDAAAAAIEASDRQQQTVYLVKAGAVLDVEPPEELADIEDVRTAEPYGMRITRRLPRASLGRRARERHLQEILAGIERDGAALDDLASRIAQVASWRRDVDVLEQHVEVLADGDPALVRDQLESERAAFDQVPLDPVPDGSELRRRVDDLRRLLPDAMLLHGADHATRATELSWLLESLTDDAKELGRISSARGVLAELIDTLRSPPPTEREVARSAERAAGLTARLDVLAAARSALEDVVMHRHAADHTDAQTIDAGLAPALEAQVAAARTDVETAAAAEAEAEAAWEVATREVQVADANRLAALAHRDRVAAELAELGPVAVDAASIDVTVIAARAEALDAEARELVGERAVTAERFARSAQAIEDATETLASAERQATAPVAAWAELRELARADGVLHAALTAVGGDRSSIQLSADAWSKRELLLDRLEHARGAGELYTEVRDAALDGPGYLVAWKATRTWLRARVPAQVADVAEPLQALERLRDHLDLLERRLGRQEMDLRGASEDVARGIDVQVRRAHGQVRRLNTQLEGIQFGSIHGIRVEIRRVDRMEQILRALRVGEVQELLFTPSVPIEEALDDIFRRYGGGGRHGGQRLLDYREYIELAVEIRRAASGDWEVASPTKLSTGEAIGVGAALMMVVLTEWERDANLLRAKKTGGSLRFLFLDEANRLSRDNLGVLFDLCKNLDLQLLIAAPEVARAEGNTTYRLVRHVTDDGREEVIVSGRRAIAEPPSLRPLDPSTPDPVTQDELA
ncbi:MAG: chromosome partition protein MukB [Kofleriaceae bacterium]